MNPVTEFKEGLGISWNAIRSNKLRSILTTLGIVIGIVTVTLMATAIEGLNQAFLKSVSAIGVDVLYVQRFDWFIESYEEWMDSQKRGRITLDQIEAFERLMTTARAIAPVATTSGAVKREERHADSVSIVGTTDQFVFTSGVSLSQGRFFSSAESMGGRPVCVLGFEVATNLFAAEAPVGQSISIRGDKFQVVGVLEKQGNFLGMFSLDNQVVVPVKQFVSEFWSRPDFEIQVKASAPDQLDDLKEEIRGVMRRIRRVPPGNPDDFAINQQDLFLNAFKTVSATIATLGLFITGLSLFVGGIGIMNIMFVSVAERTHEIGIRKAIGARQRTILIQFLIEAAAICMIGGLIGLAIAFPLTWALSKILPAAMSPRVAALAIGVALATGVLSGFFPARRAARMNPVDALRNE